jgi:uncharacterized protein (DUF58 family)
MSTPAADITPDRSGGLARWWQEGDRPGWRSFAIAMAALGAALFLALYSGAAAETGHLGVAVTAALAALGLAGWVALAIVPVLARRTPLRWLAFSMDYRFTREGAIYLVGVLVVALAALNTGNNLLFLILACLLAGILLSGIVSSLVLSGLDLKLGLPEHIFAEQPVLAMVELRNDKQTLPTFSVRVVDNGKRAAKLAAGSSPAQVFARPVYFPYVPPRRSVEQRIELTFPRRGIYREESFGIRTKFPFGFLQKTRIVESPVELLVYPKVSPTEEFYEVLPLVSGELESFMRGRGHDLYGIRDYRATDSARFVDWKASAKSGALKVREFTREDERRVVLALDPFLPAQGALRAQALRQFERAVSLCACLAWHFFEIDSVLGFRAADFSAPLAPPGEVIYSVLRHLALIEPRPAGDGGDFLASLADESEAFKIILTSCPRGSIPTSLWTSSYLIFLESL